MFSVSSLQCCWCFSKFPSSYVIVNTCADISQSYIPIWFQAVQGVSAVESGIRTIPLVLSLTIASVLAGILTSKIGYYTPFAYTSGILATVGSGLFITFDLHTSEGKWIGYQILFGFGLGLGIQQGIVTAQTVLSRQDVPMGISLMFLVQQLGGAVFISVGENILTTQLVRGLSNVVKELDPARIANAGATEIKNIVPHAQLHDVLVAYNSATRHVFVVATAMAGLACLGAALMPWRSVKGKQGPAGAKKGEGEKKKFEE